MEDKKSFTNHRAYVQNQIKGWNKYISNLDEALQALEQKTIIGLGIVPYARIVLALIVKNMIIFCVRDCNELPLIKQITKVVCVEERFPELVKKIQSTGYLLKNFTFQNFAKTLKKPFIIYFYGITPHIERVIEETKVEAIGNTPGTQTSVLFKKDFRQTLKDLDLPHLKNLEITRQEFNNITYGELSGQLGEKIVCQRGDFDLGGEVATLYISNAEELKKAQKIFGQDERYNIVELNPYVQGATASMVGCATKHGTFTGPLKLQLIDIPQALSKAGAQGVFVGHDFGLKPWGDGTEKQAEKIVQTIGDHLYKKGYKGIFGIDIMYDEKTQGIYPIECNPRFTGSFPMESFLHLMKGVPPLEFMHVVEHMNIPVKYEFEKLNQDLKYKTNFSHVLIDGRGAETMPVDLPVGIYTYDEAKNEVNFVRPALLPWEIQAADEFLVADVILKKGASIGQGDVKLFKIAFPASIAESSYTLKPHYAKIVQKFSDLINKG